MRISILLLFFSLALQAQDLKLEKSEPLFCDVFVGVDSYNHIYSIKEGTLYKTGELGDFVFQDYQLGPISMVDIINPLRVVVFYGELNTAVFLDNRLNEIERINFNNLSPFVNASGITNAGNNRLWAFNVDTQQLQLYDYRSNRETVVSQPMDGELLSLASDFNDCYVLTETTLRRINIYGSLLNEFPADGLGRVARSGKMVLGVKGNTLVNISEEGIQPLEIDLGENPIKDLQLTQDFLYIYDGKNVSTYSLTQPKK